VCPTTTGRTGCSSMPVRAVKELRSSSQIYQTLSCSRRKRLRPLSKTDFLRATMFALTLLLLVAQPQPNTHEALNPLYKSLPDPGLTIGKDLKAKLPPPTMPDGLNAAKQKEIITKLLGDDYTYDDFTRKSVVARELLKIRDVNPSDPKAPARGVDVWFVAYGD